MKRAGKVAAVLVAVLLIAAVVVAARTRSVEREVSAERRVDASSTLSGFDLCISASTTATVVARTAASGPRLLGWSDAALVAPVTTVRVQSCTRLDPPSVKAVRVSVGFTESTCHLSPSAEFGAADTPAGGGASSGYSVQQTSEPCRGTRLLTPVGDFTGMTDVRISTQRRLDFTGRTWTRDLCFTVSISVEVTTDSAIDGVDLNPTRRLCLS